MFNGIAMNPAYTGSENTMSVVGTFRAQWLGFPGAPTTEALTIHAPLKKETSSVGVQLFADQIGVNKNLGIFGSYAYRVQFNNSTLSAGISGGVNMVRANYSELEVNDVNDQSIAGDSPLGVLPEFSLGAHYNTNSYFVSLSIPMFLGHEYDGSRFRIQNDFKNYNVLLGGGYVLPLRNQTMLKPSVLFKFRAQNRMQADLNLRYTLNDQFDVGVSYRTEEAIMALFEARINKQFSVMYSFGVPISKLAKYSFGSHELSVKYNLMYKTQTTSPRFLGW